MKIRIALFVAVLAACGVTCANAAPPASASSAPSPNAQATTRPFAAVDDLQSTVAFHMGLVEMAMIGIPDPQMTRLTGTTPLDSYKDVNDQCQKALKELDAGLDPALKQAKTDPQMLAATKALYIAAQDYFTNLPSSLMGSFAVMEMTHSRLKSTLEAKSNELKLDLKLAAQ